MNEDFFSHLQLNVPDEVQVFLLSFSLIYPHLDELIPILSDSEILHAEQIRILNERNKFYMTRGVLRKTLAAFTSIAPNKINFCYSPNGKPKISNLECLEMEFNLSHSGDFLAIAVSQKIVVGIDIEYKNPAIDFTGVSEQVFTDNEIERMNSCLPNQRLDTFYDMWTIKEAFIKAIGKGFSINPQAVEINPYIYSFKVLTEDLDVDVEKWNFKQFFFDPSYAGAIVTSHPHVQLIFNSIY